MSLLLLTTLVAATPELEPPTTKTKLAVMSLASHGVPGEYGAGLTETIATAAVSTRST